MQYLTRYNYRKACLIYTPATILSKETAMLYSTFLCDVNNSRSDLDRGSHDFNCDQNLKPELQRRHFHPPEIRVSTISLQLSMASTPPAAKVDNEDDNGSSHLWLCLIPVDVMEIDAPTINGADRARRRPNTVTSKDQTRPPSNKQSPVEILDDEDEDEEEGDEEAYAVEKVLAHKIGKKSNVRAPRAFLV